MAAAQAFVAHRKQVKFANGEAAGVPVSVITNR